jgi:uncharacterized protein with GYD domain
MPRYLALGRWTQQGMENIKGAPARIQQWKQQAAAKGIKIESLVLSLGPYDAAVVAIAPNDATIAELTLAAEKQGNMKLELMPAFNEPDFKAVIDKIAN